jgi:twitching motility two-component system response regulator PilH
VAQTLPRQTQIHTPAPLADWQISALQRFTIPNPLLIHEDDRMSRQFYRALLAQQFGLHVIEAWNPGEALGICQTRPVAMILSCMGKPNQMAGLNLLTSLRSDARTRRLPFMFVTGSNFAQHLALEAGADAFLNKPCHPNDMLQTIWRLLRGHIL